MCTNAQDQLVSFFSYKNMLVCMHCLIFTTQNASTGISSFLFWGSICIFSYCTEFAVWLCIGGHSWHPHTWFCSSSCLQSSQIDLPLRRLESRSLTWLILFVRWFAFHKTLIWQYMYLSVLSSSTDMLKQNMRWRWLTQERNKVWPGGVWQVRSAVENSSGCKS